VFRSILLLFVSQFWKSFLSPNFPTKIPSSALYRRRRPCRSEHRRTFADEELADILTYEELVRLRIRPRSQPPVTMAARIIPAVSCPLPIFSGSKKEDLSTFIEAIELAHERERALYDDDETALRAKKSLLVQACKGKAARYLKGLDQNKKDTWEHLVASLTEKYDTPNAEDRARAFQKAMKLKQKSDEELSTYAKRAKKLAKRIDPALDRVLATHFTHGIRSRHLREMVVATSQNKADYTFKEVYESVRAVARSRRSVSESDSDSDSSSSASSDSDSSAAGGSRHHRREEVRKAKEPKVTEVEEVKRSNPAPTQFNMDDITKLIKEAVQASTRELVAGGSYGMAPNPVQVLGQPPQAPMIESYAVSSQSRPPFSGRSYQYGGQGGFQQQQQPGNCQQQPGGQGGYQQSGGFQQQQPGGYQQPSGQFGGPSQYPRSNITCYNCEERGHGYQQCPKPPQPDEARRAIYDRVNADKTWNYSTGQPQQQRYQPPYRRGTDNSRPAFMEPYTAQAVRSSGQPQPPVTTPQNPRISETNFVEEMAFASSALDGVTVVDAEFPEVSMIDLCGRKEKGSSFGTRFGRF
jgi:hypothetical protein